MEIEDQVEDTLSADLASAWDAAESEEDQQPDAPEPEELQAADTEAELETPAPDAPEAGLGSAAPEPADAETDVAALDKAPQGLPLEAREEWAKAPPAIKKAILQREKDYEAGIVKYSQNAKRAEAMDRTLAPYQQLFAMNGGAQNTIPGLLQTASVLQMGAPAQKATMVANLIKQFGVDVRALDNALVGQKPPKEMQEQSRLDQLLNERLGPLQQQLQHYQQRDQQTAQQQKQQADQELQKFAQDKEFYADVRADMADLLDMAANRGRQMSLEEAYKTACAAHPQISRIMSNRTSQQSVETRRRAASSIHGGPGGSMQNDPKSVTAALNAAWDNAGRV